MFACLKMMRTGQGGFASHASQKMMCQCCVLVELEVGVAVFGQHITNAHLVVCLHLVCGSKKLSFSGAPLATLFENI